RLEQKIIELESKLQRLEKRTGQNGTSHKPDSSNGKSTAAHSTNGFVQPIASFKPEALTQQQTSTGLRQIRSQGMNPNISAIGTFLGTGSSLDPLERNYNIGLQEAEFSFKAIVDPYATADFFIAAGKHAEPILSPGEHDEADGGHEEEGGLEFELEEVFVTLLHLPLNTQIKAGKFRPKFGKLNETHPHAYNIIDLPLMYQYFLGGEGFVDEGVSFRWLLPNPSFFQELTFQVLNGPGENLSFTRAENNKLLYMGHLRNFFDLSESTTLELGLLGATGPNNAEGDRTKMFAADLTIKWKPLQKNRYKSFEWTSEFLLSKKDELDEDITSIGLFSHLRYQVAKRWFIGGLAEYSEFPEFDQFNHKGYSGILQFYATEFQKFEIQGRYNDGNFFDNFFDVFVRAVFVIGAHGAHQY
ncbi:MAG: hypothetical protein ACE5I1_03420, partial [bacterium]